MKLKKMMFFYLYSFVVIIVLINMILGCMYKNNVSITGVYVDNEYHNYLAGGKLTRIEDKLYYAYLNNGLNYGVYELSDDGCKRVYWDGMSFGMPPAYSLNRLDKRLVINTKDGLRFYSANNKKIEDYNDIVDLSIAFQKYDSKLFYNYESSNAEINILKCFDGNKSYDVLTDSVDSFYLHENSVYYISNSDSDPNEIYIKRYRFADNITENVCDITQYSVFNFMIDGDNILFECYDTDNIRYEGDVCYFDNVYNIYKVSLYDNDRAELLYSIKCGTEYVVEGVSGSIGGVIGDSTLPSFNAYDGKVYIASNQGIYLVDVFTGEDTLLTDISAEECYIVDDTWVYFVGKGSTLWRIPQSGGKAEKVYG